MKFLLQFLLNLAARRILKKYHPEIIGITGSVGKTSTREAIFAVLAGRFRARRNIKNYNNEIGLPLTIIGAESGGHSLVKWLMVFVGALRLLARRDPQYPEILILEMGADHPGDITYLTNLAPCEVGVVTAVSAAHTEFFKTINQVAKEKQVMVTHLRRTGTAILNADDEKTAAMRTKTVAEVLSFGFGEAADVRGVEFKISQDLEKGFLFTAGINFKIKYGGSVVPVFLSEVVGTQHAYAALAAAAVGISYGLNLVDIAERLRVYAPPPSRMHLLPGVKFTTIIDDSYNSSPLAALLAVKILAEIPMMPGSRRIAVLGDMLELGAYTNEAHQELGQAVAKSCLDFLITVGERARIIAEAAGRVGLADDKIARFDRSLEAGRFLQEKMRSGDLILIKGSQGVRMEKIVKEVMAEPLRVAELVCRQDAEWMQR